MFCFWLDGRCFLNFIFFSVLTFRIYNFLSSGCGKRKTCRDFPNSPMLLVEFTNIFNPNLGKTLISENIMSQIFRLHIFVSDFCRRRIENYQRSIIVNFIIFTNFEKSNWNLNFHKYIFQWVSRIISAHDKAFN